MIRTMITAMVLVMPWRGRGQVDLRQQKRVSRAIWWFAPLLQKFENRHDELARYETAQAFQPNKCALFFEAFSLLPTRSWSNSSSWSPSCGTLVR